MEQTIKRCAHCEGEAEVKKNSGAVWVKCSGCGLETKGVPIAADYSAKDKAIESWNTRAESDATPNGLAEMVKRVLSGEREFCKCDKQIIFKALEGVMPHTFKYCPWCGGRLPEGGDNE